MYLIPINKSSIRHIIPHCFQVLEILVLKFERTIWH